MFLAISKNRRKFEKMGFYSFFVFLLLFFITTMSLNLSAQEKPAPGKSVVGQLEVPASKSLWKKEHPNYAELLGTIEPLEESSRETMKYWIFLPEDYQSDSDSKSWPLLLFLHGAGERGPDIEKVQVHGPPKLLKNDEKFRKDCPFIVVSPQCAADHYWSPGQVLLLLDEIEKNYKVDKKRIYATGISMGGYGTWMIAAEDPGRFAAVAPICGGFKVERAEDLLEVPLWTFHGEKDGAVPIVQSRRMVEAIEKAGGKKIKFTVYPELNHDCWTITYENPELYKWFLQHSK